MSTRPQIFKLALEFPMALARYGPANSRETTKRVDIGKVGVSGSLTIAAGLTFSCRALFTHLFNEISTPYNPSALA